mmetsp:Transcript_19381/g.64127  ORF Transcript_19381/g.64127 Transcript_19381/m.64127 type:complete len:100 (+) Transcript_19381:3677-3976(+)
MKHSFFNGAKCSTIKIFSSVYAGIGDSNSKKSSNQISDVVDVKPSISNQGARKHTNSIMFSISICLYTSKSKVEFLRCDDGYKFLKLFSIKLSALLCPS